MYDLVMTIMAKDYYCEKNVLIFMHVSDKICLMKRYQSFVFEEFYRNFFITNAYFLVI